MFAQASPTPADLKPRAAADLFQLYTGQPGNCSTHSGIDVLAEDAKQMASNADAALVGLLKSSVPYTLSSMIWSHTALNMWDTDYDVPDKRFVTFPQGTKPLPSVQCMSLTRVSQIHRFG